jgi:hypothetical protein
MHVLHIVINGLPRVSHKLLNRFNLNSILETLSNLHNTPFSILVRAMTERWLEDKGRLRTMLTK